MKMNDEYNPREGLGAVYGCLSAVIIVIAAILLFIGCTKRHTTFSAKQVLRRERISESSDKEIWRTSTYQLVTVEYDTIPKKTSWDTAHELPR